MRPTTHVPAIGFLILVLVFSACSGGASSEVYFTELEAVTRTFDDELDDVEARFNTALLAIDFEATGAEGALIELFRTSMTATAASFASLVAGMTELEPPSDLADRHRDAVRAGERVLDEYDEREADLAAITSLSGVDSYAAGLSDSGVRARFAESCRELQEIADRENITADLRCS